MFICPSLSASIYTADDDTIPVYSEGKIRKSIYSQTKAERGKLYNFLWGEHYRDKYTTPIEVRQTRLNDLYGGLSMVDHSPDTLGVFMKNPQGHLYLLRALGGYTTFLHSGFFKDIYNQKDFKETYLDDFIKDAYTITNPYAFIVSDKLAKHISLCAFDSEIYYIPPKSATDTIFDGTRLADRLVSISDLGNGVDWSSIWTTDSLLNNIKEDKRLKIDSEIYIRERLFDMMVGDWNKANENWRWKANPGKDSSVYVFSPIVIDRLHAFTKVDGFFFKGILGMFGLKSITNYEEKYGNLKKINGFSYALDVALIGENSRDMWLEQAKYIKENLTDDVIDEIFKYVPKEIKDTETNRIKAQLKIRRDNIVNVASAYYDILQEIPVVTGSNRRDKFVIDRNRQGNFSVRIYNENDYLVFDKKYDRKTKEIWFYGLGGDDSFVVSGEPDKAISMILVGGKGENHYKIDHGKKVTVYDYKSHDRDTDTIVGAKMIRTDIEKVHEYDFNKLKYSKIDFTPWGVYDSDLGLYLGAYVSKTMYGFKRSPYSYRHRIGYNYLNGFMYQGLFPSYDEKKVYTIEAFVGTPNNFVNFFGYGNETDGFKDENKKYNRVNISKYSLEPSFNYKFDKKQRIIAKAAFEIFRISDSNGRYVNEVYDDDDRFFDTKSFADVNLTYNLVREKSSGLSKIDLSFTGGWKVNLDDTKRNYSYLTSALGLDFQITKRLILATEINGTALFTDDKYEFYQAAAIDLRGYRGNRFIGKQAAYQHTDLRLDMGRLENPFTPLLYGVFVGFDYGRVCYPDESSKKWHTSYGGGFWITLFKEYTGKFSYFGSKDGTRFSFGLGLGF